jgi:hypothetical protein
MAERETMFSREDWLLIYGSGGLALESHRTRRNRVNGGCNNGCSELKKDVKTVMGIVNQGKESKVQKKFGPV